MTSVATVQPRRLLLRPFQPADAEAVHCLAGSQEVAAGTFLPHPLDRQAAQDWIMDRVKDQAAGTAVTFAITLAENTKVIGSIGNRASTLNTVINGWGNRTGLLAVGDLNVAITGIAWAGGHANAPPASGKDRMTWISRNAEAREGLGSDRGLGYLMLQVQVTLDTPAMFMAVILITLLGMLLYGLVLLLERLLVPKDARVS